MEDVPPQWLLPMVCSLVDQTWCTGLDICADSDTFASWAWHVVAYVSP